MFSNLKTSISLKVKLEFPVKKVPAFCPVGSWYVLLRLALQLFEFGALTILRSGPSPNVGP